MDDEKLFCNRIHLLPDIVVKHIFHFWQPDFCIQMLAELTKIKHPLSRHLQRFCLSNLFVERTEIVADMEKHIGIAIHTSQENGTQTMVASVHVSRMTALKGRRICGTIKFIGLSAVECRRAFVYLRNHVRLEHLQDTLIYIHNCYVSFNDLESFMAGTTEDTSFTRILFTGRSVIIEGITYALQNLSCQFFEYDVYDQYLLNQYNVIHMLTNVRRALPLQSLILYEVRGPIGRNVFADFIGQNIAAYGSLAVFVDRMEYRATFYQELNGDYNGPPIRVAFSRTKTNDWCYREIGFWQI